MNLSLKKNQVYQVLRQKIISGELPLGSKLPGETVLAQELNVSRVTLRSSLDLLAMAGLIQRIDRKGTFVAPELHPPRFMIITPDNSSISNPFNYIVPAIQRHLDQHGAKVDLCSINVLRTFTRENLTDLLQKLSISGIFLAGNTFSGNEPELELLKDFHLPIVLPHGALDDQNFWSCPILLPDYRNAFLEAIRHIRSRGHRRIAILNLTYGSQTYLRDMTFQECRAFLGEQGADDDENLIVASKYDLADVKRITQQLMALPQPPTAIACFSDFFAIYLYKALTDMGFRIPQDVSVMGFCGYPEASYMNPPLSTVDLGYEAIGQAAADLMLHAPEWFQQDSAPRLIYTPYQLIQRQSVSSIK